jgi:hypothetical protein
MTDGEILQQEEKVRRDFEKAQRELNAQNLKIQGISDHLENLVYALRNHPELVTGTPSPGARDYLEDLSALDRKTLLAECEELRRLQERVRLFQKRLASFQQGTRRSTIE